jgi:L-serine/L-threonine ammonia-lyase
MKNKLYNVTPTIYSSVLSKRLKANVYLKLENLQPSGSFKNRGIGHFCQILKEKGINKFYCSSGGNAGLAVSYSGRLLGIKVTVVIPETTPSFMVEKLKEEGAEVIVHGKEFSFADQYARKLVTEKDEAFISPYDHPEIWEGHESLIDEVENEKIEYDCIVLSVGGGGLYAGIIQGLKKHHKLDKVNIIAIEPEGSASLNHSLKMGKVTPFENIKTIATSLAPKTVSAKALEYAQTTLTTSHLVSDLDCLNSIKYFLADHQILVEPACGASLSALYEHPKILEKFKNILVIVCGGNVVNLNLIKKWEHEV